MRELRRDEDIHHEDGGWFQARWHFSFGSYHDPDRMGVGALRVFNDDRIVPGAEWPMHPHADIESLTYVVEGLFAHADSLGNGGRLEPGAAQVMTFSSRGAQHSERNGSDERPLRFLQFWILPGEEGLRNAVQQRQFTREDRTGRWLQVMGPRGEDGLDLHQDARVRVSRFPAAQSLSWEVAPGRGAYLYLIDGELTVDDDKLATGDALVATDGEQLTVDAHADSEVILIDVPLEFQTVGRWRD